MNLSEAKQVCRALGHTLTKVDGEYILVPRYLRHGGYDLTQERVIALTYFTDNLDDAVGTCKAQAYALNNGAA